MHSENKPASSQIYTTATHLCAFLSYAVFLATLIYGIGFVGNILVPKSIDSGPKQQTSKSLFINMGLLMLVAIVHHQLLRESRLRNSLKRIIPPQVVRSTDLLIASLVLVLLFRQWRPIPEIVWTISGESRSLIWILFGFGALATLSSAFKTLLNAEGFQPAISDMTQEEVRRINKERMLQHSILIGSTVLFWATPLMTWGHLILAIVITSYLISVARRDLRLN